MAVGTVMDEMRVQEVPKLKECALHVSTHAQSSILEAGSKILTFNQLSLDSPKGLLSGPRQGQEVRSRFIKAPGAPHSHTKTYLPRRQGLEAPSRKKPKGQMWLQKLTPGPTLLLKRFWRLKKKNFKSCHASPGSCGSVD